MLRGAVNLNAAGILKITPFTLKPIRKAISYYIQCGCGKKLTKKADENSKMPKMRQRV